MNQNNNYIFIQSWMMVQNNTQVEGCFFTIHTTFEEACTAVCEYVKDLPNPLPELYYKPIEQPKRRLEYSVQKDKIIQLKP